MMFGKSSRIFSGKVAPKGGIVQPYVNPRNNGVSLAPNGQPMAPKPVMQQPVQMPNPRAAYGPLAPNGQPLAPKFDPQMHQGFQRLQQMLPPQMWQAMLRNRGGW